MRISAGVLLPIFILLACGRQTPSLLSQSKSSIRSERIYTQVPGVQDFFFIHDLRALASEKQTVSPTSCRDHIADVVCLTDGASDDPNQTQVCRDGGKAYAPVFQELYDQYPPALQRMFCSLKTLNILDRFVGTAYGGLVTDKDGHVIGAEMGIRKSVLDEHLSLDTWATWKEELSFGGVEDAYVATPGLPYVETNAQVPVNSFLYFVVTHEFGHMFDFANDLNKTIPVDPEKPQGIPALFAEGSWGSLSWHDVNTPLPEARFPYRRGLCFYFCNGEPMLKAAVPEVYRGLAGANFISTYAASNPADDFADSLAYHMMDKQLGLSYQLHTGQGEAYDMVAKWHSLIMASKRQFIIDFLARPQISYP